MGASPLCQLSDVMSYSSLPHEHTSKPTKHKSGPFTLHPDKCEQVWTGHDLIAIPRSSQLPSPQSHLLIVVTNSPSAWNGCCFCTWFYRQGMNFSLPLFRFSSCGHDDLALELLWSKVGFSFLDGCGEFWDW